MLFDCMYDDSLSNEGYCAVNLSVSFISDDIFRATFSRLISSSKLYESLNMDAALFWCMMIAANPGDRRFLTSCAL